MMESGIYSIKNIENGKIYIGSAVNIKGRWSNHVASLRGSYHPNPILQRAWDKYGEGVFEFSIIEEVKDTDSLIEREQFWIDEMNVIDKSIGYNLCPIAGKTSLGVKRSEETKAKLSIAATGRKKSRETIEKHANLLRGRRVSDETHANLKLAALARKGIKRSPEICAKIGAGNIGKIISIEAREKLRIANIGKKMSEETKAKISASSRGRKLTAAHKAAISASRKLMFIKRREAA